MMIPTLPKNDYSEQKVQCRCGLVYHEYRYLDMRPRQVECVICKNTIYIPEFHMTPEQKEAREFYLEAYYRGLQNDE